LSEGKSGQFVLGCMDLQFAFCIPYKELKAMLPYLNTTTTDRSTYWHIHLVEGRDGQYEILLSKQGTTQAVNQFRLQLSANEPAAAS